MSRLTDGDLAIARPITLVCGENGAGKSSLLHTLVHAVVRDQDTAENVLYCRPRLGSLDLVEIEVSTNSELKRLITGHDEVGAYFFPEGEVSRFGFIDTGMHVPAILEFIKRDTNFGDLIEGIDPVRFDKDELDLARFIVGRYYEEILVYEILDTPFAGVLPYFKVVAQGASYDTLEMGYGEIAVIYILWVLARVPPGSLILIEEPETFLSPRGQTALVDAVARYIKDKQLFVVMTSHSGAIAVRMRNDEIIYATRSAGRVSFHNPSKTSDLVSRLGLVPEKTFVLFLEDFAAKVFAQCLIERHSVHLRGLVEYSICNGEGGVTKAIAGIPDDIHLVVHLGVLDGDQRTVANVADSRIVFLPGTEPPEALLIAFVRGLSESDLSRMLDADPGDVARASAHADGEDLHSWFHTFAAGVGAPYSDVLRRITAAWARSNPEAVAQFVSDVERFAAGTSL